jgi:hypothetical protein
MRITLAWRGVGATPTGQPPHGEGIAEPHGERLRAQHRRMAALEGERPYVEPGADLVSKRGGRFWRRLRHAQSALSPAQAWPERCLRDPAAVSGLRPGRAGLWQSIYGIATEEPRIWSGGLCSVFSNFRFGAPETGSMCVETGSQSRTWDVDSDVGVNARLRKSLIAGGRCAALARPTNTAALWRGG